MPQIPIHGLCTIHHDGIVALITGVIWQYTSLYSLQRRGPRFVYINVVLSALLPIVLASPNQVISLDRFSIASICKMKTFIIALVSLAAQTASAFPSVLSEAMLQIRNADRQTENARLESRCPYSNTKREAEPEPGCPYAKRQAPGLTPPFDAKQQYVSNTGAHQFIAPSGNDQRGPCKSTPMHA